MLALHFYIGIMQSQCHDGILSAHFECKCVSFVFVRNNTSLSNYVGVLMTSLPDYPARTKTGTAFPTGEERK